MSNTVETGQQQTFQSNREWFGAFLKNTDQKPILAKRIQIALQSEYPRVWDRLIQGENPSILYVGPGNGDVEIPVTAAIVDARVAVRGKADGLTVHCVDTSDQLRDQFLAVAKTRQIGSFIPDEQYVRVPFQDTEDSHYKPPKVDLAVACHVWYYIPQNGEAVSKFVNAVEPGGLGLIVLLSNQHDYFPIREKETQEIYGMDEQHAEKMLPIMDELGIPYKTEIVESHLTISSCFKDGQFEPNEEGKNLLSFILRANWDEQPKERQSEVGKMLSEQVQKYQHEAGKEFIICRDLFIWLPR